jgi:hypothetical protein
MGLLKTVLIGAAVYGAVKYLTKKDMYGRSVMDDIKEKAPEWMDKAREFKDDMATKYKNEVEPYMNVRT